VVLLGSLPAWPLASSVMLVSGKRRLLLHTLLSQILIRQLFAYLLLL
jgi:hypothetical protein